MQNVLWSRASVVCVCVSVCLSVAVRPHYCTDPDVTWGHGRGCPLVVHYWGGFAIGAWVGLLWQHNAKPSYKLASIPRYDNIVRTAVWAGFARVAGRRAAGAPIKTVHRIWEARPPTGGGVLNITAAVWNAVFHWWRSGNKKRTQNVSEYMLVLALCLVLEVVRATCRNHKISVTPTVV